MGFTWLWVCLPPEAVDPRPGILGRASRQVLSVCHSQLPLPGDCPLLSAPTSSGGNGHVCTTAPPRTRGRTPGCADWIGVRLSPSGAATSLLWEFGLQFKGSGPTGPAWGFRGQVHCHYLACGPMMCFHGLVGHLHIFFGGISVQILCPLSKNWAIF